MREGEGGDAAGGVLGRREFLAGLASIALVGCGTRTDRRVAGGFADDGGAAGHALGDGSGPASLRRERADVVIVGGGIAGLSAAWWLERNGFDDFLVLEMEGRPGGNSRWGEGPAGPFPWAAHYIPVPGPGATLARELMTDLGVLVDGAWDESMLVFSPEERLFRWGRWSEGLLESLAETAAERSELRRFDEEMRGLAATGQFTIPSADGAPDDSPLDRITMAAWLDERGFRTPALRWYVDYACRDDYGARPSDVSAWAGVHYFAARPEDDQGPLAWPQGNGWVVERLMERFGDKVRTGQVVRRVEAHGGARVGGPGAGGTGGTGGGGRGPGAGAGGGAGGPAAGRLRVLAGGTEYTCDAVIWAAPSFVAPWVVEGAPPVDFEYSPWVTAAVTVDRPPLERGAPPAWDNVIHRSSALGYVVGGHQSLATHTGPRVWTWYTTLSDLAPPRARALLARRSWAQWKDLVLADLEQAHPDIRRCVSRIDVMRMGHAMIRPTPGFLSSGTRRALRRCPGPVFYAHSDLSGLSLFEEAQHRGVTAARNVLDRLRRG